MVTIAAENFMVAWIWRQGAMRRVQVAKLNFRRGLAGNTFVELLNKQSAYSYLRT